MKEEKTRTLIETAALLLSAAALSAALASCGGRPAVSTAPATPGPGAGADSIFVSVAPMRAALVTGEKVSLTATTNDRAGVAWSVSPSAGAISPSGSPSQAAVTFTAPQTAGVYTVTAASVTEAARSASATIAVTDLAGMYTYHDDLARDGANEREYALRATSMRRASGSSSPARSTARSMHSRCGCLI